MLLRHCLAGILCLFLVIAKGQLELRMDKHFALESDVLNIVLIAKDNGLNTASAVVIRDKNGKTIHTAHGRFESGISKISLAIPSTEPGWYDLSGFTYNADFRPLDLIQTSIPLYSLPQVEEASNYEEKSLATAELTTCENEALVESSFITATLIYEINEEIKLKLQSDNHTEGSPVTKTPIFLKVEKGINEQVYFGFFRPQIPSIIGLRNVKDNIFKIELDRTDEIIEGQVLGTDAFGNIKKYKASVLPLEFDLPPVLQSPNELPISPALIEYGNRLRKRIIIENLYEQYAYYPESASKIAASNVYLKDQFVLFNDTEEFIDEVVPLIRYKKKSRSLEVLDEEKKWLKGEALIIVNNEVIQNKELNETVDYSLFKEVSVYREKNVLRSAFGAFGRNGVIFFETKGASAVQDISFDPGNRIQLRHENNGGPRFINGVFGSQVELDKITNTQVVIHNYLEGASCLLKTKKLPNP